MRKEFPHEKPNWKGYDIDELRYLRAYMAARLEINRDRIKRNFSSFKDSGSVVKTSNLFGKVLGALSYLDVALLAFRIGGKVFKTMRLFRRKR